MSKRKTNTGHQPQNADREVPRWIAEGGDLYWRGRIVLHLAAHAATERSVLAAFQEAGWASVIADPLPREPVGDPTQPRRSALWNLNHRQGSRQAIVFFSLRDGHIGWRPC